MYSYKNEIDIIADVDVAVAGAGSRVLHLQETCLVE